MIFGYSVYLLAVFLDVHTRSYVARREPTSPSDPFGLAGAALWLVAKAFVCQVDNVSKNS